VKAIKLFVFFLFLFLFFFIYLRQDWFTFLTGMSTLRLLLIFREPNKQNKTKKTVRCCSWVCPFGNKRDFFFFHASKRPKKDNQKKKKNRTLPNPLIS